MDASTLRLIKEMQTFGASLREKSLFQVFSVDEDATDDDVRARYTDLVRRFHPDRLSQQGLRQEILDQAKDLSSRLNDAYQTLANAESRKKYLALVKDERIKGSAVRKVQIEEADKKFKMAQILLKKRDFARCRDLLKTSLEIDPNNGEYKAYMAWALWMDPTLLKDVITPKVVGLLKDAVRLAPENAQVHYFIGSVMKVTGDNAAAVKHFKKAVSVDPSHVDASRELRLVEMRKKK
jgi:curved DNA-binding protein CbpA